MYNFLKNYIPESSFYRNLKNYISKNIETIDNTVNQPGFFGTKAVIFDLDGVITDTSQRHEIGWRTVAEEIEKEKGIQIKFNDFESLRGVGRSDCLNRILEGSYCPANEEFSRWLDRKNEIYVRSLKNLSKEDILPGAKEIIKCLKDRGIKIAIGSSSKNTPVILRQIGLQDEFDAVIDGNQISKGKPDAEVFTKAAKKLCISPENCVVIEDAQSGIDAANNAGMQSIGVVDSLKNASYKDCLEKIYFNIDNYFPDLRAEDPDIVFYDAKCSLNDTGCKKKTASLASILSVENGYFGTRSDMEEGYKDISTAGTYIAGIYIVNPENKQTDKLAIMPDWTKMQVYVDGKGINVKNQKILSHIRYFDTKKGVTVRELKVQDNEGKITQIKTEKFASLSDKNIGGKCISITPLNYNAEITIKSGIDASVVPAENNVPDAQISHQTSDKTVTICVITPEHEFEDAHEKGNGIIEPSKHVSMSQRSTLFSFDDPIDPEQKISSKHYDKENKIINEEWNFAARKGKEYKISSLVSIHSCIDDINPLTYSSSDCRDVSKISIEHLEKMEEDFYAQNYESHTSKMNERMKESCIIIKGDPKAQRYANFALARLIMAGENNDQYHSICARTLTGPNYAGHVFWDFELYDFPFYYHTNPELAKNMLMYRYHTLPAARENKDTENKRENSRYKGARYAWESSSTGIERTPPWVYDFERRKVKVMSAIAERHIVPDIAYSVYNYWKATGDDEFMRKYGTEIMLETARYSRSMLVEESDGKLHTKNLLGPDEYHERVELKENGEKEGVHDNAFSNILIKHNLDKAGEAAVYLKNNYPEDYEKLKEKINYNETELQDWNNAEERIYIPVNSCENDKRRSISNKDLIIDQFRGFHDLKPVDLNYFRKKYGEEPAQKFDIVIKKENKEIGSKEDSNDYQVIKQPDVLMIMQTVPDRLKEIFPKVDYKEVIKANYEEYEPKTSHGSSLSTGIHSQLASRIGKEKDAYKYFILAGGMDIDDTMGNAYGGIHAATLGATWMALTKGFGGMELKENGLEFSPALPGNWNTLEYNVKWHGQKLNINITRDFNNQEKVKFIVGTNKKTSIPVCLGKGKFKELEAGKTYCSIKAQSGWIWSEDSVDTEHPEKEAEITHP